VGPWKEHETMPFIESPCLDAHRLRGNDIPFGLVVAEELDSTCRAEPYLRQLWRCDRLAPFSWSDRAGSV
jgi:hypothetical protein